MIRGLVAAVLCLALGSSLAAQDTAASDWRARSVVGTAGVSIDAIFERLKQQNVPRCTSWRPDWRAPSAPRGRVLRVELAEPAVVTWTADGGQTKSEAMTRDSGLGVHSAAIPTADLAEGTRIVFSWRTIATGVESDSDFEVRVR